MRARRLLGVLVLLVACSVVAAGSPNPAGFWKGSITLPNQELEVMIEIEKHAGVWMSSVYVPAQGIRDVDMINVSIEGNAVSFEIPGPPGKPTFTGELSTDGKTISGLFTQASGRLPFRLDRTPKPAELDVDIYAAFREPGVGGAGLAGDWRGIIESGPHRMRLVLHVSDAGESYQGTLDSPDQGAEGLVVDGFEIEEDSVRFRMTGIGVEYEGTMKSDGSEISGRWRQGGQEIPLAFRRARS